ncbi:MAG TPA: shikimate kinase [Candidatus Eisenbergiella merdipullorum]|uniref:Shikimate kinase n=1 Tax=Candidatus Eisenbergiella merdipullorum TaxID=2838553 RepID=A0A9D2I613_9FIRM|nr:shikimate kinase [Candidatus Eisenbergiella merdipullorum]
MRRNENIVLIGMPGAGKSTVGVVLAKHMGRRFLDSDLVIQEKTGKLLHELITERGLQGFLDVENEINKSLDATGSVIATGGSVIYGRQAMDHLKRTGVVVYLRLSYPEIENRLGDLKQRGVALKEGQTLRDLYEERVPLYEKYADLIQECDGKSIRTIVAELAAELSQTMSKM